MKIMIIIISLLIIFAGVLPFLGEGSLNVLPTSVPTSGVGYSIVVILIGVIGLIYGFANKMIMGLERIVTITITLLTVLGGVFPLIVSSSEKFAPIINSPFYSGFIIIIGLLGLVYGVMGLG